MLHALFGSRNLERILLFLFVNERCYATQIQTLFQIPLTPIQKALQRLEKGGIVHSYYEGKIRIYQLTSTYPFRCELEMLLKRAYTLLPASEKKQYCFIHKPRLSLDEERKRERHTRTDLFAFWQRLSTVKQLTFSVKSRGRTETDMKLGKAEVTITASSSTLVFQEKGHWLVDELQATGFSNSFRWTLDANMNLLTLEHLRYGLTQPVFLFHLTITKPGILESIDSHLYAEDAYLGNIIWSSDGIQFHWRIIGPHKNEELLYCYT